MYRIGFKIVFIGLLFLGFTACKVNFNQKPHEINLWPEILSVADSISNNISVADTVPPVPLDYKTLFPDKQLHSIIEFALENNNDLKAIDQNLFMASALVKYNKAQMLPDATAVAGGGIRRFGEHTIDGVGNYDTNFSDNIDESQKMSNPLPDLNLGIQSVWEVDIWLKQKTMSEAAYKRYLATEQYKKWVRTQLVSALVSDYYTAQAKLYQIDLLDRNIKIQEAGLELVKVQRAVGKVTELAVNQFEAQLNNTKSLRHQISQQLIEVTNSMAKLSGRYSLKLLPVNYLDTLELPVVSAKQISTKLLANRPDIRQAEFELQAADMQIYAARAAFLPSLTLASHLRFESFNPAYFINPTSVGFSILGGLGAPLFSRRLLKTNLTQAQTQSLMALYQYQQTAINAYLELSGALNGIDNAKQAFLAKKLEYKAMESAITNSKYLFSAGYANYLEVITAQKNAVTTELELADLRAQQYQYCVALFRSLGGM